MDMAQSVDQLQLKAINLSYTDHLNRNFPILTMNFHFFDLQT